MASEDIIVQDQLNLSQTEPDQKELELNAINKTEIEEKKPDSTSASSLKIQDLEKLFADRYTKENPSYAEVCRGFNTVVIIHPWASRTKRIFDYTRGRGDRGGWRGGRGGGWRGGRNHERDYRGDGHGYNRKRQWHENGSGDRNSRVHYPGRR